MLKLVELTLNLPAKAVEDKRKIHPAIRVRWRALNMVIYPDF
jgi:hypothetical protein